MQEPVLGHLLVLGTGTAIVGIRVYTYASAGREETDYLDVLRIHEAYEVLHDGVDAVLVEVAVVAEAEEVELQRLRFHESLRGDVANRERGEVRLARLRAERRELRARERHPVVPLGMLVGERLQQRRIIVARPLHAVSQRLQFAQVVSHCHCPFTLNSPHRDLDIPGNMPAAETSRRARRAWRERRPRRTRRRTPSGSSAPIFA